MEFVVKNWHAINEDAYWNQIFFDDVYTRALYLEGLAFSECSVEKMNRAENGRVERVLRLRPSVQLPSAIQKLIGDHAEYRERGVWEPSTRIWSYQVIPGTMVDKTSIEGSVRIRADRGGIERECVNCVQVRIFGLGRMVEQVIEQNTRQNLEKAAKFTDEWIRAHRLMG